MTGIYDNTIASMGSFAPTIGLTFADALEWDEATDTSWTFPGPYVWDVTVDSFLIVSAAVGGDPGWPWLSIWDIDS